MDTQILKIAFLIGLAASTIIRIPYQRETQQNTIIDNRKTPQENGLLFLVFLGMVALPLVYVFTPWLDIANYHLSIWANGLGVVTFAIAMWLFWRSHHDLGKNWSPTLQIREAHTLIVSGIYQKIRHPMYASVWLWSIAQALLLPNWIAGLSGIIGFGILYIVRVRNEEQMMLDQFGAQYQEYMHKTKRLIPYLF
ncbi:Isoprenylcysteine carboxyl methyltransferase [Gloeocapsa sp. PCC 7428]|uniref:protein-S-isoprenylcysteine O-methyltransferase n=1 Tax=Gloeocapsa sp. PCC 7428 TaxID=1173026 RepID=UPI0002A60647|nr:protein-S-isoprenylcysteine O-methyltransferase [Gloeocapsa sp. PCC 7428]AFZ29081.1 Isoprenylcysteine carboxyl methyltransferase [Gloeocapsa sp. PCC 7428]